MNFPPGNTFQTNFTAAIDVGAHAFVRRSHSMDFTGRVLHLSNAYLGTLNPGVPGIELAYTPWPETAFNTPRNTTPRNDAPVNGETLP